MKLHKSGGFWLCYAVNLLFNLEWTIPAWLLLALHVWCGVSMWWFVGAILLWAVILLLITLLMSYIGSCASSVDRPKKNKNPYSASRFPSGDDRFHQN